MCHSVFRHQDNSSSSVAQRCQKVGHASESIKQSHRDIHSVCQVQRLACKGWFSLEVYSDTTDLKLNMGNHASEGYKAHDISLPFISWLS